MELQVFNPEISALRTAERLLTCFDPFDLKPQPIKTFFMEPHQVSGT